VRREPVDITDQRNHGSNLSLLFLSIQHLVLSIQHFGDHPDAASAEVVEKKAERSVI
jgi:hypothetical protein